uniref:Filamentous hemagglutinin, intein-containing n=1 Tax=Gongylonema pulchrum TaxID=637853 RepID=A0A183D7N5_9BILA
LLEPAAAITVDSFNNLNVGSGQLNAVSNGAPIINAMNNPVGASAGSAVIPNAVADSGTVATRIAQGRASSGPPASRGTAALSNVVNAVVATNRAGKSGSNSFQDNIGGPGSFQNNAGVSLVPTSFAGIGTTGNSWVILLSVTLAFLRCCEFRNFMLFLHDQIDVSIFSLKQ